MTPVATANAVETLRDPGRVAPATAELIAPYWSRLHRFAAMVTRNDVVTRGEPNGTPIASWSVTVAR